MWLLALAGISEMSGIEQVHFRVRPSRCVTGE